LKHNKNLNNIRREYKLNKLSEKNVRNNPFAQFSVWFSEVLKAGLIEPNSMALSTTNKNKRPSARIVLMKDFDETGFTFFTNYESKKGKDLTENPFAALLFYWIELERQVRIEGRVKKLNKTQSELYFHSRSFESRLSAIASAQSKIIIDRTYLEKKLQQVKAKHPDGNLPLPDFWGGYKLIPNYFEFWQGRENRLHDRIAYKWHKKNWKIVRLAP
jgi:pyridoxamine 5'-phosphate oxidase